MPEKKYKGIVASPGIVIGRAYLLDRRKVVVADQKIQESSVKDEIVRFKNAVTVSRNQLEELKQRVSKQLGPSHLYILDTHIMLLEDSKLSEDVIQKIAVSHVNAEGALKRTIGAISHEFDLIEDEYLRDRKHDVDQVGERIQIGRAHV
jgi:phosphotransferase system enzyme I (PtsI)